MPRIRRTLPLGAIQIDRLPFKRVLDFVRFIERGGKIRPIKVEKTHNGFRIRDGRHRYMAYKLLGRETIEVTYGEPKNNR